MAAPERQPAEGDIVEPSPARPRRADEADTEIVRALEEGDRRLALRLCARQHGEAIGRLCTALTGSQADADDIAQETLLEAHRALGTWRREGSLRSFLMVIARRKSLKMIEKRRRRGGRLRLVYDAERERTAEGADGEVTRRERAERARAALSEMKPSEREALILRFAGELSFREVADACGIAEPAARKRVSRALARLRATLNEETES